MDFIGNKKVVNIIQRSICGNTLSHAYIFSGPQHVGKFTLAKMFAFSLIEGVELRKNKDEFNKDALLDLIIVQPEVLEKKGISKQRDIAIESVREAKKSLSLFPYCGKHKVLIIDDAHKLSVSAQNALLKILEEPNQTTVMILVTHEIDRILPTILSRCQVMNFSTVEDEEMREAFSRNLSFSQDCIGLSMGRPGLAQFLNENIDEKKMRIETLNELERVGRSSVNERFKLADEFSKDTIKTLEKLDVWIWEMRKIANSSNQQNRRIMHEKIEKIQKSINTLKRSNANTKLVLETLFMDL